MARKIFSEAEELARVARDARAAAVDELIADGRQRGKISAETAAKLDRAKGNE